MRGRRGDQGNASAVARGLGYSKQMRAAVWSLSLTAVAAVVAAAACSGRPAPAPPGGSATPASDAGPAATASSANRTAGAAPEPGCTDAAAGFDRATRGMRPPETSFRKAMHERCLMDRWPTAAIACFATMVEGGLGTCAVAMPKASRDRMFAALGSGGHDGGDASSSELSLAISFAKLQALEVGVAACDAFVSVVQRALACAAMPVEARVSLGAETVDFWSLPTGGLPEGARQKMSDVCDRSRAKLEREILAAGCMP